MAILAYMSCGHCGYDHLYLEDHREAPIPPEAVPMNVYDINGEGRPVDECPKCKELLPEFRRRE